MQKLRAVDFFTGAGLLIERNRQEGSKGEVDLAEVVFVGADEVLLHLLKTYPFELLRVGVYVENLEMLRKDNVNHLFLHHREVVAVADVAVAHQFQYVALCKRGEEEAEFDFVVAVFGVEHHFEFLVGHHRVVAIVVEFAGEFLQIPLFDTFAYAGHHRISVEAFGSSGEAEIWRRFVSIHYECPVAVFGARLRDAGGESFAAGHRVAVSFVVPFIFGPIDCLVAGVGLHTH